MSEQVTQEILEQTCREWQDRLRLRDWNIEVELVDSRDIPGVACLQPSADYKMARLQVGRPEHFQGSCAIARDWEHSIVHELLHLHFADWQTNDEREATAQEQAINLIASALVGLAREARATHDDAMASSLRCEEWQMRAEEAEERAGARTPIDAEEILGWLYELREKPQNFAEAVQLALRFKRQMDNITAAARSIAAEARLCVDLTNILAAHCGERGDNEGAVGALERIIREREEFARRCAIVRCAYCSSDFPKGEADPMALLAEHIRSCAAHPLRQAEGERDEAREVAREYRAELETRLNSYTFFFNVWEYNEIYTWLCHSKPETVQAGAVSAQTPSEAHPDCPTKQVSSPDDPCPDCGSCTVSCWDCKDAAIAELVARCDDANRALEMERAANRVTADRLNRLADDVRLRFPAQHYLSLPTMEECGGYPPDHDCAECRLLKGVVCDGPRKTSAPR